MLNTPYMTSAGVHAPESLVVLAKMSERLVGVFLDSVYIGEVFEADRFTQGARDGLSRNYGR